MSVRAEQSLAASNNIRPSRGVALLLVLILLIAIAALGPSLLSRAWSANTEASLAAQRFTSATLADDTAIAIASWLSSAPRPASDENHPVIGPGWINIADRSFPSSTGNASWRNEPSGIAITDQPIRHRAWGIDLAGRAHVRHAGAFAADAIPVSIANAIDREAVDRAIERRASQQQEPSPLPPPLLESLLRRGTPVANFPSDPDQKTESETALTTWWTTHGSGSLNIATAPLPILEAALLGLDPLHTSAVLDARRAGQPPPATSTAALIQARSRQIADEDATRLIPLTDRSDAVGVLVETTFASHINRTWFVLTPPGTNENRTAQQQLRRRGNRPVESTESSPPWQIVLRQTIPVRRPATAS